MLFLLLTILAGSLFYIVIRLSNGKVSGSMPMITVNYLTCSLMATMIYLGGSPAENHEGLQFALLMGAITGALYLADLFAMEVNIRVNGLVLNAIYSKLGLLVPVLCSFLFFGEIPAHLHILGIALALVAIVLMNYRSGNGRKSALLLFTVLATDGCAMLMLKVFNVYGNPALSPLFLAFNFGFAALFSFALALARKERFGKNEILFGIAMGLPNSLTSYFLLMALETVPAFVVYPTRSVGTILLLSAAGVLFFREKLRPLQWAGVATTLAAIWLVNS